MYFRLILFALGTIFLLCRTCSDAQNHCGVQSTPVVETLHDACGKSHQLQIKDAYICQEKYLRRCDRDCKPRAKTDHEALCSPYKSTSGPRCKARLNFTELNEFYDAADRGKPSLRVFDKQFRNRSGDYYVSYTCADGTRPAAINPCRSLTVINPAMSFRSILVIPDKRSEACVKTCTLQPTMEQVELQYHVLFKENTNTESNFLEMKAVHNNGLATEWKRLDNSYFNAGLTYLNVREMKVRFHVADLARVTRLWLSMKGGTQFSLSCTDEDTNPGTTDTSQSDQEQQKNNDGHSVVPIYVYIVPSTVMISVLVALTVFLIVRKRRSYRRQIKNQHTNSAPEMPVEPELKQNNPLPPRLGPLPPIPTTMHAAPSPKLHKKRKRHHTTSWRREAAKPNQMDNLIYLDSRGLDQLKVMEDDRHAGAKLNFHHQEMAYLKNPDAQAKLNPKEIKGNRYADTRCQLNPRDMKRNAQSKVNPRDVDSDIYSDARSEINPMHMETDIYPDAQSTFNPQEMTSHKCSSAQPVAEPRKMKTPKHRGCTQHAIKSKHAGNHEAQRLPVSASATGSDDGEYVRLASNTKTAKEVKGGHSYDRTLTAALDVSTGYNIASRNPKDKRFVIDNVYDRTK